MRIGGEFPGQGEKRMVLNDHKSKVVYRGVEVQFTIPPHRRFPSKQRILTYARRAIVAHPAFAGASGAFTRAMMRIGGRFQVKEGSQKWERGTLSFSGWHFPFSADDESSDLMHIEVGPLPLIASLEGKKENP